MIPVLIILVLAAGVIAWWENQINTTLTRIYDEIDAHRELLGLPPCNRPKTYKQRREGK